ncbi:unnamed protein product [Mycena citricolor]|uniref:(2E,6E)-farnesyl diphosphate synthase n=1 Tax=Mycena citricolor TaxID=2018698 RepID=A0AAD2HF26_9AGAR|nr:unnamed protein product [Mycena citricolor]
MPLLWRPSPALAVALIAALAIILLKLWDPSATPYASRQLPGLKGSKRDKFGQVYELVRDELLGGAFAQMNVPEEARVWYQRNMDYNVPGGKLNRGLSVVDSVEIITGRDLSDAEFLKASVLGWAVEFLQASFLVLDDVMDKSHTRRGQPCYYRVEGVGSIALNDAMMLEASVYRLLRHHFRAEPYYADLIDLFHHTTFQTNTGQLLDLITAPEDVVDLSRMSIEKFRLIARYKTAYYSFYLPVALAMIMTNIPFDQASLDARQPEMSPYGVAKSILIPIGEYFQVQDDFLDFAGAPETIGKVGTDIVDNKCSWCINTALQLVTADQRRVLDANYGRHDQEMEVRVKAIFEDVGLRSHFADYERRTHEEISLLIARIPDDYVLKKELFRRFLDKIYKRQK